MSTKAEIRKLQAWHVKVAIYHLRLINPDILPVAAVEPFTKTMREIEPLDYTLSGGESA
jgi:hypothetical protein